MRELAPLPGPDGLFRVSTAPRFLADSAGVGWQGAFFTEVIGAPEGTIDHAHERYCLVRMDAPVLNRQAGCTVWQTLLPGLQLACPGQEQHLHWRGSSRSEFLFIAPERAQQLLDGAPSHRLAAPDTARLRALNPLIDALRLDLAARSPAGRLVGDSLVAGIVGLLSVVDRPRSLAVLDARAQRRLVDYVDAHLDQSIPLSQLAAVAGLGERHLLRAFRTTMGCSPHQYLLARRVERAKARIAQGWPLASIAQDCGFADQSQLTRTFRQHAGTTPGRWRVGIRQDGH